MNKECVDDSDENDIFMVKRPKPIGWFTREKTHNVKKEVLGEEIFDSKNQREVCFQSNMIKPEDKTFQETLPKGVSEITEEAQNDSGEDVLILEEIIKSGAMESTFYGNEREEKKTPNKNKKTPKKSPLRCITHYFSPTKKSSMHYDHDDEDDEYKRKEIKSKSVDEKVSSSSKWNPGKRKLHQRNSNDSILLKTDNSGCTAVDNVKQEFQKNYCYSLSLKKLLHYEVFNQASLEKKTVDEGKVFDKLISSTDLCNIAKFFKLPENAFELYSRMLCRKKCWHRISKITYPDIDGEMEDLFRCLNSDNFVDFDVVKENTETLLNMLSKSEVQSLCTKFNIKLSGVGNNKSHFIDAFLNSEKTQRSVIDMWTKGSKSKREQLLRDEVIKLLGPCVKLNESFLILLNRLLLLFSLSYMVTDQDWWSSQMYMMLKVNMKILSFPHYEVNPTVIFEKQSDLIFYEKAIDLMLQFDDALVNKKTEKFLAIGPTAKNEFKQLLDNERFKERVKNLPPFLRKFSAGSVYARILTKYCDKYKKFKSTEEVIEIMKMLLSQDVFLIYKKGKWYDLLVMAYLNSGRTDLAYDTLLSALKGNEINEVERLSLQQKGESLLKKKNCLKNNELRKVLDDACTYDVIDPLKVEIRGKALDNSESGSKMVYTFKNRIGEITFLSVEENVINHYKQNGYEKGVHDEGSIIKTLYCLVFFDIIYNLSPSGVFQNPYQSEPLDFSSKSFYLNRKTEIDLRLEEMRTWSFEEFEDLITRAYTENFSVQCVIAWREEYSANVLFEILRCLGIQPFTSICERLVRNYRVYRSGFPDLTIWNSLTGKCKFVEVKSPNDKLKPNQRLWLDFLKKQNVDCEVCNVKNIASKRLISSPRLSCREEIPKAVQLE